MGRVFSRLAPHPDGLKIKHEISQGAYGTVYSGTLDGRPVAAKKVHQVLLDYASEREEEVEAVFGEFRRECELSEAAKHANLVEFLGVFNHDGNALFVTELMAQTLEKFLNEKKGKLSREKQIDICRQIASGLLFLHQHDPQILHCDLTAKNVLMNKDGSVAKISDFGQAKFRPSSIMYLSTKAPGCLPYMPPEYLVETDKKNGTKSHFTDKGDVFSLGVLILQSATQSPPSVGLAVREGQPEVEFRAADLVKLPDNHPLRPIILRCLQNDPAERPSCLEVLHFLLFEHNSFQTSQLLEHPPTLHSEKLPDMPLGTYFATAVVIGRNVFVCEGTTNVLPREHFIQAYDLDKATWTQLPPTLHYGCAATAIENQLVIIGGHETSSRAITNMVSSWTGDSWEQNLPALPTKRSRPSVMTYGTYVIVAGGLAEDDRTLLSSLDVLDTATRQWQTPATLQLPQPLYAMQMTVCTSHIYVAGALITKDAAEFSATSSKSVWQLPVSTFVKALEDKDHTPLEWVETASTPLYHPALLQHTAHPLAIGGCDKPKQPTPNIAMYDSHSNEWSTVGQLLEPRIRCTVVGLSRDTFMVCGGCTEAYNAYSTLLKTVELVHMPH